MDSLKIRIPGRVINNSPDDEAYATLPDSRLQIEKTYEISATTRGEAASAAPEVLDEQKVVQFEFTDGTVWLGDYTTIEDIFPGTSAQVRSVEAGEKDIIDIPVELATGDQSRGDLLQKVVLKVVKIFTKKAVLPPLIRTLAENFEKRMLDNRSGVYRLTEETVDGKKVLTLVKPEFEPDAHYLLFIHGTASSTLGAFSKLQGSKAWELMHRTFGRRILAFEHETLTKSAAENVLDLVQQLPEKAALTIISHSRGGLVGDILNRYCAGDGAPDGFSAKEKNFLRRQDRTGDLDCLEKIDEAIRSKTLTIDKFIRVASSASGTTLASKRLDIYFNVIANLIGMATGQAANPVFVALKELIVALIESKGDASSLPGLEVQNPKSPFNQMLNNAAPETTIDTPLLVIAGDSRLSLRWQAIKVALANVFFLADNDLVVNTRSMYNGAKRADGRVQYFFDQGGTVDHFNYFGNAHTQTALFHALQTPAGLPAPSFTRLDSRDFTKQEIRNIQLSLPGGKVFEDKVSGSKPIVVLLPGIMGSTLTVRNDLVWINYWGFVGGSLTSLAYSPANNPNVRADGLVGSSYRKLTEYLKRDYDVVTFPFDWRTDMAANASALNQKLLDLMKFRQPVKLVGHSMGGVLIRDFILNFDSTWQVLKATRDFRLLFLGSPLGGSFRIPYVLFGLDSLINTLDMVDLTNSQRDLLEVFSKFPGILSLLPLTTDGDYDFASPDTWEIMRNAFGDARWPIPPKNLLDEFRTYRDTILDRISRNQLDLGEAMYIAGQARHGQQTVSGYRIENRTTLLGPRRELVFLATQEGDESVTWDSGIPASLNAQNVYYSDVPHGELANDSKLFGAIADLLSWGATRQLKRTRPTVRSIDKEFRAKTRMDFNLTPEGVEKTLLGLSSESPFTPGSVPITVSVSNGHLKYAAYPIMAGHFEDDGIQFAEAAIDGYLNGELSRRHQLGLYPGQFLTSETVVFDGKTGLNGALILGLGRQGQLTEFRLAASVEQGVANYLADLNNRLMRQPDHAALTKPFGISALLIGSGYGGLRIENAVRAIIQGTQDANEKVRRIYKVPRLIETIEFIELYKDRALACVKAINAIARDENRSLAIFRSSTPIKKLTGWRERLPLDDTTEWWTRISVRHQTEEKTPAGNPQPVLRFSVSTDAARYEERPLLTIDATLTSMLDDLSRQNAWSPELARAIFELMVPNDFKPQVKRQSNINWILDKYTAAFPWELLQDRVAGARPLCVSAGMIRQLETGNFRINVTPVVETTAIVIADPDLKNPFMQLPAALEEGTKVADSLAVQGFAVDKVSGGSAAQILQTLFSKDFKVVHLAGHGVFNADPRQPTGMLIGPDAYLTPAHIDQMSNVPELVFVNCCYLGKADGVAEDLRRDRFRLAANIGTQLIEIGVKAVVVAGWAVEDSAAHTFAERFYQCLFEGSQFGDAVKKARKSVYEIHGTITNTWGAYQCYGDPFYRLYDSIRKPKLTYDFVIAEEAEIELSNLLNQTEVRGYDPGEILQTMDAIEQACRRDVIQSVRITELQALLYSSLNQYELAIAKFCELWKSEKAGFSFSTTEKYCNTQAKWQVYQVKRNGFDAKQARAAIQEAIADLQRLLAFGETAERLNLIGSSYKRLAFLSNDKDKQQAYEQAATYYQKAYRIPGNKARYYPLSNWLSVENALVLTGTRHWGKNDMSRKGQLAKLNEELAVFTGMQEVERDYWDWIAEATLNLTRLVLGDPDVTYLDVLDQYKSAWQVIGNEGQRQAEIEHLEILADALGMSPGKAKESLAAVSRLKTELEVLV
ncbi:hypothetical protein GCM10023189_58930 [Nibrella saemangeumensis]|uniref:CHAT domain-containing protein n=1 Tax=Nibrella saemangeumensis TaxID=1084526 RepID=A0ABP8NP97_9BACT